MKRPLSLSPSRIARTMGIIDSSDDVDKEGQLAATDNEAVRATEEEHIITHICCSRTSHKSESIVYDAICRLLCRQVHS